MAAQASKASASVEERGGAGLEVRTVYNWFTGYDSKEGVESAGLTRRMVDLFLLSLAQEGRIRISDKKGHWIDRATIADTEFKPEHLRNLNRIELPRALPKWQVFYPYLEVILDRADGSLGPKHDKATADEAIRELWANWINDGDIKTVEDSLRDLFSTLGRDKENPFDELLIYWLQFADEKRPDVFESEEAFAGLCRAVVHVAGVGEASALTSTHLTTFKENRRRLAELRASFSATRSVLLRAARLGSAQLPGQGAMREIERAQADVMTELEKVADLVISPDTVSTRLVPRVQRLEEAYTPAYLDTLMELAGLQDEIDEIARQAVSSAEIRVLSEFEAFGEARTLCESVRTLLADVPKPLRRKPESRDAAEREVRSASTVKEVIDNQPLTFKRLVHECEVRRETASALRDTPRLALDRFASFLRSPRVADRLRAIPDAPKALTEVIQAASDDDLAEVLVTMPAAHLNSLASVLVVVVGDKRPKSVHLAAFRPQNEFIWETSDIEGVVNEFRDYLRAMWEDQCYLRIKKE